MRRSCSSVPSGNQNGWTFSWGPMIVRCRAFTCEMNAQGGRHPHPLLLVLHPHVLENWAIAAPQGSSFVSEWFQEFDRAVQRGGKRSTAPLTMYGPAPVPAPANRFFFGDAFCRALSHHWLSGEGGGIPEGLPGTLPYLTMHAIRALILERGCHHHRHCTRSATQPSGVQWNNLPPWGDPLLCHHSVRPSC